MRLVPTNEVFQLSMQWDFHINPQLFNLTLRTSQEIKSHLKKQSLPKAHIYLKDRNLHHRYAYYFVLTKNKGIKHDILEARSYFPSFV